MKELLVGLMIGFMAAVAAAQVTACASTPEAVGYTTPPDAGVAREAGDDDGATPEPGNDDGDAGAFSPYLRGALAVQARGCPACHQSADAADGVLSGQTTPIPGTSIYGKNLTPDPETGIGGLTDAQILLMMRQGKDDDGSSLCNVMPRYIDMNADEESAILVYLHALAPVHREIPDGVCAWTNGDGGDGGARTRDGGDGGARTSDGGACASLVRPDDPGPCHACMHPPCQANGCFNGFLCDPTTRTCHPPAPGCE
jgi:hypothetical protein